MPLKMQNFLSAICLSMCIGQRRALERWFSALGVPGITGHEPCRLRTVLLVKLFQRALRNLLFKKTKQTNKKTKQKKNLLKTSPPGFNGSIQSIGRGGVIVFESEASLVYISNSRTVRAAERDLVSNKNPPGLVTYAYNPSIWELETVLGV